jgi:hypothetical protein
MSETKRRAFVTENSVITSASREDVMGRIRDSQTWPEWQSEILTTEGSRQLHSGEDVRGTAKLLGFLVDGRSRIEAVTESSLNEDVIVGVRMRVRFEVMEDDEGCVVTHHLIADLPGGATGRLLSWFLRRRLKRMSADLLRKLVAQSEETSAA